MEYATSKQMRALEINSAYFGVPAEILMENAGRSVCEAVKKFVLKGKKILVVCGTGNNGGDGFVAARYLAAEGWNVKVMLVGKEDEIKTQEARKNFELLKENDRVRILSKFEDADIILDALLGTGVKGELREPLRGIVKKMNKARGFKVSVDVPSGLDCDAGKGYCVDADMVVTFHKMKKGLEKFDAVVKDIGIPKEAEIYVGPGDVITNFGKRMPESHKGENGRVLVVGGSDLYYGAPILAAEAALNSGADLTYLAVPEINYEVTRSFSPDFIVREYAGKFLNEDAAEAILELAENCDSVVIGPGLGKREETKNGVLKILNKIKIPAVIDADAINAVGTKPKVLKQNILTPHAAEFKTLTGEKLSKKMEERQNAVQKYAKKFKSVILLKAHVDIIASPNGEIKLNATGNAGMTVGGTGDVLAGIVAGFAAQNFGAFEAACCAAFVNGAAGDELYKKKGYCFTASDIAGEIPYTIKRILEFR